MLLLGHRLMLVVLIPHQQDRQVLIRQTLELVLNHH
jgi:hypothetical protein